VNVKPPGSPKPSEGQKPGSPAPPTATAPPPAPTANPAPTPLQATETPYCYSNTPYYNIFIKNDILYIEIIIRGKSLLELYVTTFLPD